MSESWVTTPDEIADPADFFTARYLSDKGVPIGFATALVREIGKLVERREEQKKKKKREQRIAQVKDNESDGDNH
jgi:hypothetical protein